MTQRATEDYEFRDISDILLHIPCSFTGVYRVPKSLRDKINQGGGVECYEMKQINKENMEDVMFKCLCLYKNKNTKAKIYEGQVTQTGHLCKVYESSPTIANIVGSSIWQSIQVSNNTYRVQQLGITCLIVHKTDIRL